MASLSAPQRTGMVQNSSYSSEHTVVGADETGKMSTAGLDRPKGAMPPTVPTLKIQSVQLYLLLLLSTVLTMIDYSLQLHIRARDSIHHPPLRLRRSWTLSHTFSSPLTEEIQRRLELGTGLTVRALHSTWNGCLLSPPFSIGAAPKAGMEKPWIPFPLRPWFWIPFVVLLIGIAIGLEVALHISNKRQGKANIYTMH
jgi:hypothetical protein